jgi:hypothetical protein
MIDLRYICRYYNEYLSIFREEPIDITRFLLWENINKHYNNYINYHYYNPKLADIIENMYIKKYTINNMMELIKIISIENARSKIHL